MQLKTRIAKAMQKKGWNPNRLAAEAHKSITTVQNWLTGKIKPSYIVVKGLSVILEQDLTDPDLFE